MRKAVEQINSGSTDYQFHIDVLRGIAVGSVVLFHSGLSIFPAGFFGVDIFFVISGFLITSIIQRQITSGYFSFTYFMSRRLLRIVPNLFFIILCSSILSWLFFEPRYNERFIESAIASLWFYSNIFFVNADYFQPSLETSILIHTWSLAVEEQIYIVLPILLILLNKIKFTKKEYLFISAILISFILALFVSAEKIQWAFYLSPTRFWEFLIGGYVALFSNRFNLKNPLNKKIIAVLAVIALGIMLNLPGLEDHHPGFITLIPVLASASIILYGSELFCQKYFLNRILQFLGLISFSVYLWHQVVFATGKNLILDSPSLIYILSLLSVIICLSIFTRIAIEQSFLNLRIRAPFHVIGAFIFTAFLFMLVLKIINESEIFLESGKFNDINNISPVEENDRLRLESWNVLREKLGKRSYFVESNISDSLDWFPDSKKERLLVVGNSHSKDVYNILHFSEKISSKFDLARFGAQIRDLESSHEFWKSPNYLKSHIVLIASRYDEGDVRNLSYILRRMRSDKKIPVVMGKFFEFKQFWSGRFTFADKLRAKGSFPDQYYNENYWQEFQSEKNHLHILINDRIEKIAVNVGVGFIDRMEYFCDGSLMLCYAVIDGNKTLYDYGHHTIDGARFFAKRLEQNEVIGTLIP